MDNLTKLTAVEPYKEATGDRPILLIESDPPSWKTEGLELLGFNSEDWIEWSGTSVHCERLLVPSQRRSNHFVDPEAIEWVRRGILSNVTNQTDGPERVYVSRKDASRRRVLNEDEVSNVLEDYGFKTFVLSELGFKEQVELFAQANMVVGPHGAGFTNTIFSDDITLIEFFGSEMQSRSLCYYGIANARGFDYRALQAESEEEHLRIDPELLDDIVP